jgi:membrane fusion protein (multidrug efflux system)
MADTSVSPSNPNGRRRQLLTGLAAVVIVSAASWGLFAVLIGGKHVETDNAYVGTDTAQVNALVAGPIAKVLVSETQM